MHLFIIFILKNIQEYFTIQNTVPNSEQEIMTENMSVKILSPLGALVEGIWTSSYSYLVS